MEQDVIIQGIFQMVASGIIVPLVDWLQRRVLPLDFPIRQVVFVFVLCFLSAWGLAAWLQPASTWRDILTFTLFSQVVTQFFDAGNKTRKEILSGSNN